LRLHDQARLWSFGYGAFVVLTLGCAAAVWRRTVPAGEARPRPMSIATSGETVGWWRRARWIALAFVPSSLLLAVTNYISTDVASVPLLWIAPLALYLLSFVIAFSPRAQRTRAMASRLMPLFVLALALMLISGITDPLSVIVPLHLIAFFVIAVACHAGLANDRPCAGRLTEFYFWIACGGMVGGLFNALLAPVIFSSIVEYPLVLIAACLVCGAPPVAGTRRVVLADLFVPSAVGLAIAGAVLVNNHFHLARYIVLEAALPALIVYTHRRHRVRFAASVAAILVAGTLAQSLFGRVVYAERTFFGVNRVRVDERLGYRFMFHGTTLHGMQSLDPSRRLEPTSYFHRIGPIGQVFAAAPQASAASDIAIIGLGIGTLASYRAPAQQWTYYEIDPVVEQIASNESYFTYLAACGTHCRIITGDGRISIARAEPHKYGMIVIDAFSSDAVPMHLMTKESLALYLSKLAPGGVIAVNISNVHLSFSRVLARIAGDAGLVALWQREPADAGSWAIGKFPSEWFIVARNRDDFGSLTSDPRWKVPVARPDTPLWTDDFSNILSALR
jgi:spermidine synthase